MESDLGYRRDFPLCEKKSPCFERTHLGVQKSLAQILQTRHYERLEW
jgi:hypothetical protein